MSELLAPLSPLPNPDPDDAFHYWDYKELNERKISSRRAPTGTASSACSAFG